MEKKISRRDFLKGSVAGTASLAAAGLLASCAAKPDPTPTANNPHLLFYMASIDMYTNLASSSP